MGSDGLCFYDGERAVDSASKGEPGCVKCSATGPSFLPSPLPRKSCAHERNKSGHNEYEAQPASIDI